MHTGHVQQERSTSSFASWSAISDGHHLHALRAQTGGSEELVGGNYLPSVDQLDACGPFLSIAQCRQMSFVQLTEIVVRVKRLHLRKLSWLSPMISH